MSLPYRCRCVERNAAYRGNMSSFLNPTLIDPSPTLPFSILRATHRPRLRFTVETDGHWLVQLTRQGRGRD
jgi:hypothetical protein